MVSLENRDRARKT